MQYDQSQSLILEQISEIKDDIRMIKSHIYEVSNYGHRSHSRHSHKNKNFEFSPNQRQKTHSSSYEDDENINNLIPQTNLNVPNNRIKSQSSADDQVFHPHGNHRNSYQSNHQQGNYSDSKQHGHGKRVFKLEDIINQKNKRLANSPNAVQLKVIAPMIKEYKLEGPEIGNIFYGYSKRNSQPVAIKYSEESQNHII